MRSAPKLTLVSRLQALLHEGRLKIEKELADRQPERAMIPHAVLTPIRSLKIESLRNERSAGDRNAVAKNGLNFAVF